MNDGTRILGEFLRATVAAAATTTLSGALNASALSFTVASGAAFAGYDSPLVLKIDSEYVIGTRSSNTITVDLGCRGALGSTAATHSDGATVSLANLYIVAGSALWADKLPDDFGNTAPTILYRVRGGAGPDTRVPSTEASYEFFIYGGTRFYDDTEALARLLYDRLHGAIMQTTASGVLMSAHQEVPNQNATEPETEFPRAFTAYAVETRSL